MKNLHRQTGLTLVEIMVALTLGVLILGGVMQVSLANKETNRLQSEINFVQTNLRTATQILTHNVRMAGFVDNNDLELPARLSASDGGGTNDDEITLTFQSNTDCLGQDTTGLAANAGISINRYFTQNLRLMCEGNGNAGLPKPLVDGVEGMQILFGEDTDADGVANQYVTAPADMTNIVAVRIAMRFHGEQSVRAETDTNKYVLLDASSLGPYNDRLIRRETTLTIALRN